MSNDKTNAPLPAFFRDDGRLTAEEQARLAAHVRANNRNPVIGGNITPAPTPAVTAEEHAEAAPFLAEYKRIKAINPFAAAAYARRHHRAITTAQHAEAEARGEHSHRGTEDQLRAFGLLVKRAR
jgi:hypothetical protein